MKQELNIVVNGESYNLFIEPKTLLVQVIREHLGLKGTHQACDSSSCAACTVILDGKAVKSCSVLALQANGKSVTTVEGLAEGTKLPPEMKHMTRAIPVGNMIGDAIMLLSHRDVRVSVLGHIQRGGSPTPYDRILATRFGVAAVDLIAQGAFGKMVRLQNACHLKDTCFS